MQMFCRFQNRPPFTQITGIFNRQFTLPGGSAFCFGSRSMFSSTKTSNITVVGSGNWGSVVGKIVAENAALHDDFNSTVRMWVHDEVVDGQKLSHIINTEHENVKYLPGVKLPSNLVAFTDLRDATVGGDVLIFILPHQFLGAVCSNIGDVSPGAFGVTCIKGMFVNKGEVHTCSEYIQNALSDRYPAFRVAALSGANVANELAHEEIAEATIGIPENLDPLIMLKLFKRPYFSINYVGDVIGVECGGALKNVVALAAGFVDGMRLGSNTKAAVLRLGLQEMTRLAQKVWPSVKEDTFLQSCGLGDLITTCYAGRNRKCAEEFAKTGKSWEVIEEEILNGQKLQGTLTCQEVHEILEARQIAEEFPLFNAVYEIAFNGAPLGDLTRVISND